jgi:hypothetical protein
MSTISTRCRDCAMHDPGTHGQAARHTSYHLT